MKNIKISLDLRIVCLVLLGVIVGLIIWTQPWNSSSATSRTITIDGQANIEAEPDEFQFTPSYQQKGTDRTAIQQQLITKVNGVIAKLKELGVPEANITLNSATYDNYWNDGTSEITSNSLTIIVDNKELAQTVQDYLITTAPEGQITPYPTFSESLRKDLEQEARLAAIADARIQAERTATELGESVGKVLSVEDVSGGGVWPMIGRAEPAMDATSSLPILPGEQDITYQVKVVFELK